MWRRILVLLGVLVAVAAAAGDLSSREGAVVRMPASTRYQRNRLHRFTFGGGYRALWEAPITIPVLDLAREGGGLVPTRRFGGKQTPVLGLKGRDGRAYTFRSTDKDPSVMLPEDLQDTFVSSVVQDQMGAQHPGAALVAGVISEAAGVMTQRERLVVMPDDPALGEFRHDFAGMLGTFYEYPLPASASLPGFHGATEIIDHEELYERLAESPADRVDARAFLRARLVDLLIGDFDRHPKQWRWARLPGKADWQPIPEDRDMAFVRYEGVLPRIVHVYVRILQRYGPHYDDVQGLTLHGWEQDRWLLPALSWSDWEAVARDVQARTTDAVIERAIRQLPPEYVALDGARLRDAIRGRRDRLVDGARGFYEHLAGEVAVQATNAAETVTITRFGGDRTTVEITHDETGDGVPEPFFRRTFVADETDEVRVYLRGGDDRVAVAGGSGPIVLRVVAGDGAGVFDSRLADGAYLYDAAGTYEIRGAEHVHLDQRVYEPPPPASWNFIGPDDVPARDWGSDWYPLPRIAYEKDVGFFLGTGFVRKDYDFRKTPWASHQVLGGGWAFTADQPRVDYVGRFRRQNSRLVGRLELLGSGIETLRFYGFGNESDDDATDSFFRVRNQQFRVRPTVEVPLWSGGPLVLVGQWLEYSRTKRGGRLIDRLEPYGSGKFGSVGAFTQVRFDTRRSLPDPKLELALPLHGDNVAAGYPLRGVLVDAGAGVSPALWDVESTWTYVSGAVSGFVSAGEDGRVTLAARAGGKRVFGRYPYFGAAYVGGGELTRGEETIRGFRAQRFGGDASVFGNLDLRVFVARVKLLLPGDLGFLVFGDAGRVFVDEESSSRWHASWGGGIWFAPLARTNAFSFSVADSAEDTLFYLRNGFHF